MNVCPTFPWMSAHWVTPHPAFAPAHVGPLPQGERVLFVTSRRQLDTLKSKRFFMHHRRIADAFMFPG